MVFQILVHIQRVQILGVKTSQQHIHYNGYVNLVLVSVILVAVLLVFDALLDILIIRIEFIHAMIRAILPVILVYDRLKGLLLLVRINFIVHSLLIQVLLNLHNVLVALGRR